MLDHCCFRETLLSSLVARREYGDCSPDLRRCREFTSPGLPVGQVAVQPLGTLDSRSRSYLKSCIRASSISSSTAAPDEAIQNLHTHRTSSRVQLALGWVSNAQRASKSTFRSRVWCHRSMKTSAAVSARRRLRFFVGSRSEGPLLQSFSMSCIAVVSGSARRCHRQEGR